MFSSDYRNCYNRYQDYAFKHKRLEAYKNNVYPFFKGYYIYGGLLKRINNRRAKSYKRIANKKVRKLSDTYNYGSYKKAYNVIFELW